MKKLLFIILLAGIAGGAHAQKGFRVGVKGAFNSTWLFNKNVSDAGDELDFKAGFGPQYGLTLGYFFTEKAGITVDVLMGTIKQKYTHRIDSIPTVSIKFESERLLKTIDIPVLFHLGVGGGVYVEVGPQLSLINSGEVNVESATISVPIFGNITVPGYSQDINYTKGSFVSAALGIGYDAELTDKLGLTAGLRFVWGLGDVFSESAFKKDVDFPIYNPQAKPSYEPTNAAAGGLHVGLTYRLGKD